MWIIEGVAVIAITVAIAGWLYIEKQKKIVAENFKILSDFLDEVYDTCRILVMVYQAIDGSKHLDNHFTIEMNLFLLTNGISKKHDNIIAEHFKVSLYYVEKYYTPENLKKYDEATSV